MTVIQLSGPAIINSHFTETATRDERTVTISLLQRYPLMTSRGIATREESSMAIHHPRITKLVEPLQARLTRRAT